jgi:FRG domain
MEKLKKKTINAFSDFVQFVETNCTDDTVLFRGQREDKPLLPKIARISLNGAITGIENKMVKEFKRQSIPFIEYQPNNEWDWLALMQHHGLATRLLDWSLNPLAGLWFSVAKPATQDNPGVVWVFNPSSQDFVDTSSSASPYKGKRTRVFQPNHVTRRIVSQSGWFTVHKYMEGENRFIPLERNKTYKKTLTKLTIPAESFSGIRYQLDRFGINSSSMFPSLDGLCENIQWLYSTLKDEKLDTKTDLTRKKT